jgi:exonuclease SbcC
MVRLPTGEDTSGPEARSRVGRERRALRLERLSLRGLTRFVHPVSINFEEFGPGLIALVGANGEGKTTVLEAVMAALYKSFPSRPGSLYDYAHGKDAYVEAEFSSEGGARMKVRVQIDAERRTTEGYIFLDGEAKTTGRSAEFGARVEEQFGSQNLLLTSVFAAQDKTGNFLLLPKAQRKALFVELLGIGQLEVLAQRAKEHHLTSESGLTFNRSKLADLDERQSALPAQRRWLEELERKREGARERMRAAAVAAVVARDDLEAGRLAAGRIRGLEEALHAAEREAAAAEAALLVAGKRPKALKERAVQDIDTLRGGDNPIAAAEARRAQAAERILARRKQAADVLSDEPLIVGAERIIKVLVPLRKELADIERAAELWDVEHRRLEQQLAAARIRMKDAAAGAEKERARLTRQAGLLTQAPCTDAPIWNSGVPNAPRTLSNRALSNLCPLLDDAREAREQLPGVVVDPAAVVWLAEADDALSAQPRRPFVLEAEKIATIEAAISQAGPVAGLRSALVRANQELIQLDREAAAAAGANYERELAEARAEVERRKLAEEEIGRRALAEVEEAEAEVLRQKKALGAIHDRLQMALKAHDAALRMAPELEVLTSAHRNAARASTEAQEELTRLSAEVAALASKVQELEGLTPQREAIATEAVRLEAECWEWSVLAAALGKDGVQALEIDAAGPEVARLTNELLEACYGPRFSLAFETLREKKSRPGEFSEAFDVRVFDAGHERGVEALSGGERVVVGEALGLAIAIFNARKSGIRWRTLFRDETAGALDPKNAQAYVDMLRRALALGGFHQILFVSHSPEIWERADVRLRVAGGRVEVEA